MSFDFGQMQQEFMQAVTAMAPEFDMFARVFQQAGVQMPPQDMLTQNDVTGAGANVTAGYGLDNVAPRLSQGMGGIPNTI